jgi:membrane-associated protease RseP (regulator of RpoE activity)
MWWTSGVYASGQYTTLEPGKKVAFVWHHSREPEPARIQVTFTAKNGGTQVTLTHAAGAGKKWAPAIQAARAAWESALENLQSVLDTGIDLRVARLPRLGILIDDFDAGIATRLSLPVKEGIRLGGVADGTGAQAAGLQKDDVIVKMGGKKAVDFPSLSNALQGRHGGDKVALVFYRGADKKTVSLELSHRPIPEAPPTAAGLAETARKDNDSINAELLKMIEGLSEAQAEHWITPDAWSIKESLAHFIACERDFQSWVADMLNDNTVGDSLEFRPNVTERLKAIVATYPTLPALIEELKRSQGETVDLIGALPAEFVARKHMYRRVALWTTEVVPSHYRDEHFGLMQSAIESARRA